MCLLVSTAAAGDKYREHAPATSRWGYPSHVQRITCLRLDQRKSYLGPCSIVAASCQGGIPACRRVGGLSAVRNFSGRSSSLVSKVKARQGGAWKVPGVTPTLLLALRSSVLLPTLLALVALCCGASHAGPWLLGLSAPSALLLLVLHPRYHPASSPIHRAPL